MRNYFNSASVFQGTAGVVDIYSAMTEIIIFTASRCLQGKEVREKLNSTFAQSYHDLDMGFTPINFLFPGLPLPRNRKRDIAHRRMAATYMSIIQARRDNPDAKESADMIWNLMNCTYKDGSPMPDKEIAHLMIALLMAGQASSAVTSSWTILHLAAEPEMASELYNEQLRVLGSTDASLSLDAVQKLPLHANVVRETLRLHPPVLSVMRKVKRPIPINGSAMYVPSSNILLAAIGHTARSAEHFKNPDDWNPRRWNTLSYLQDEKKSVKVDYGYGPVSAGATNPYLPFGGGRHRCIGEQFTYLQLTSIVATMVRAFEFENVGSQKGVVGTDYSVSRHQRDVLRMTLIFTVHGRSPQSCPNSMAETNGKMIAIGSYWFWNALSSRGPRACDSRTESSQCFPFVVACNAQYSAKINSKRPQPTTSRCRQSTAYGQYQRFLLIDTAYTLIQLT